MDCRIQGADFDPLSDEGGSRGEGHVLFGCAPRNPEYVLLPRCVVRRPRYIKSSTDLRGGLMTGI